MLERLEREMFTPHLNSTFRARENGLPEFDLVLTEVVERTNTPVQEVFTLLFRGPVDAPRPQGMLTLEHKEMGTISLFLTPIKLDSEGLYFEAVFNRLREP